MFCVCVVLRTNHHVVFITTLTTWTLAHGRITNGLERISLKHLSGENKASGGIASIKVTGLTKSLARSLATAKCNLSTSSPQSELKTDSKDTLCVARPFRRACFC